MTRPWVNLPSPPERKQWCVACVAFAKARINREYGEQIVALENDGKDEDFWFEPKVQHLEVAVVRGLCAQLGQGAGLLDLCWTHVAGIEVRAVSPLDPAYQQAVPIPPGLLKGR